MLEPIREEDEILRSEENGLWLSYANSNQDIPDETGSRERPLEVCPCCREERDTVEKRSQNTRYVDEEMNWFTGCIECHDDNERYWVEKWEEYHSGLI